MRVPPKGDNHRVTGWVEYNGIPKKEDGTRRRKNHLFSLVCLGFRSDQTGLTPDLYQGWRKGQGLAVWNMPLRAIRRPIIFFLWRMACQDLPASLWNPSWHPSPTTTHWGFSFSFILVRKSQLASGPNSTTSQRRSPAGLQIHMYTASMLVEQFPKLWCNELIYYEQRNQKQSLAVYHPISFGLIFLNVLLKLRCLEI